MVLVESTGGPADVAREAVVYLNNAATSHPKPARVLEAVAACLASAPAEPGRSSRAGGDPVARCRARVASLFGVADRRRVALLPSATHGLNAVIAGMAKARPGGRVVTTTLEHTSVLRPCEHLRAAGEIELDLVAPEPDGAVEPGAVAALLRPETCLVVMTAASNVTGCVQPVAEVAEVAAKAGVPLLVDAAQSAGAIPLDVSALPGRVFVAFAGHKGLLGPTGTGGVVVPDDELPQTLVGGTGVRSESLTHPAELPLRHEAGTPNLPGLAGLAAGVEIVLERGVEAEGAHRDRLVQRARAGLAAVPGMRLSPLARGDGRAGIVSFTVVGRRVAELGQALALGFGIETRTGLHCAPLAHEGLGTAPEGSVRASFGPATTAAEVDLLVAAVAAVTGAP